MWREAIQSYRNKRIPIHRIGWYTNADAVSLFAVTSCGNTLLGEGGGWVSKANYSVMSEGGGEELIIIKQLIRTHHRRGIEWHRATMTRKTRHRTVDQKTQLVSRV